MANDVVGRNRKVAESGPAEVGVEVGRQLDAEEHSTGVLEAQTAQALFEWPPLELVRQAQLVQTVQIALGLNTAVVEAVILMT